MWFMIKTAFWFSLVLIALPLFDTAAETRSEAAASVSVTESVSAVVAALEDLKQICERQPDVCDKGGRALESLGVRAREGARIAYEFLDDQFGAPPQETTVPDESPARAGGSDIAAADTRTLTGSTPVAVPVPAPR